MDTRSLLEALLLAKTGEELKRILDGIGDSPEIGLDVSFGDLGLRWHAFGNSISNISTIGLGTKPGRSLTERLTNATDALLENRVQPQIELPSSPRKAAKSWFGRPISGPDEGLFKWDYSEHDLDRRISVVLLQSGVETCPTIDVLDSGTGISGREFPSTILSLQGGNKIAKRYLIGAFGQGGAATLAFADYVLIVSRHKQEPRSCAFTVIRVLNLSDNYKEDCYGYLATQGEDASVSVPVCEIEDIALDLYQNTEREKIPVLSHGTLVRHIGYKLPNLSGNLGPGTGNLYHYLHSTLFDPLFPFRIYDMRAKAGVREELIRGSRNRLLRLQESEKESRTEVRHYRSMEYVTPLGAEESSIGIEYWVVFSHKKIKGQYILRAQSNELFIETGYPILGTLNGQNQGQLNPRLIKDAGLGMVSRHIVVHLDCTNASNKVRRELFSTSREGFKDGPVLDDLSRILQKMLEEDENLFTIERELTEKIAKREAETTNEEVKRQVTSLLAEAGLQVKEQGPTFSEGGEEKQPTTRAKKRRRYRFIDPLPTLPFPQVTNFRIVSPDEALRCHINDTELVLVETDADTEFDRQGRVAIRFEPPLFEQAGKAPLRGGRVRWRVRPKAEAKHGDTGTVIVSITKPDGTQLTGDIPFEILSVLEQKTRKEKGFVPPFKIMAVDPYDHPEDWTVAWPNLDPDSPQESLERVAYRPVNLNGTIHVFYSTIFAPYKQQIEKFKLESPAWSELLNATYTVWIAYHAILQENSKSDESEEIEPETFENLLERDRIRVAQMQIKQAMKTVDLTQKTQKLGTN